MKLFLAILLCLPMCGWGGYRTVKYIQFDRNCAGYLKRAADANTIEKAKKELKIAVDHLEKNKLTEGYTSVLWTTPDEDVGFWYSNLRLSLDELNTSNPDASQLEKSNLLMKLRETLLDAGESGDSVTVPSGMSVFPNNTIVAWLGIFFGLLFFGGLFLFGWWFTYL